MYPEHHMVILINVQLFSSLLQWQALLAAPPNQVSAVNTSQMHVPIVYLHPDSNQINKGSRQLLYLGSGNNGMMVHDDSSCSRKQCSEHKERERG